MVFNYSIEDDYGNCLEEFDYEVDDYNKLNDAWWDILLRYEKDELIDFIVNGCSIEDFEDDLHEYFEKEARQWRKETR